MKQMTMKQYKAMQEGVPSKRKGPTPEGKATKEILAYARAKGWIGGRVNTMGTMREGRYCLNPNLFLGFPDLVFFRKPPVIKQWELIFVEVKSPKGKLSPNQLIFQELCYRAGIRYIVARKAGALECDHKTQEDRK